MVSTSAIMRRLVWIAVLSCLVPPIAGDCNTAKAASSGTCSAVGAISGIASIFLCAGTLGLGCGAIAVAGIASAVCNSVADNVSCGGGGMDPGLANKLNKITNFLKDIEKSVNEIADKIDIGFFEAKYITYINKIRAAESRYELDVVQKNMDRNGMILDSQLVRDWVDDALGDGDYNVRGALDIIDGMVTGVNGISRTPSVYELAMSRGQCTEDLLDFVTYLILEGTNLAFIALEHRGDGVHQADKDQLANRIKVNREMFLSNCGYFEPSNSKLRYDGIWGSWGEQELCPSNGYAVSFKQRVEGWQGDNGDDTALNSICLICNTGKEVCSSGKSWGSWSDETSKCKRGFYGANLRFEPNQGRGDDTAANDFKMKCRDGSWKTADNGKTWGSWLGFKACPSNQIICGLKTRVEGWQGNNGDDSALNGVELACCHDKWTKERGNQVTFKGR